MSNTVKVVFAGVVVSFATFSLAASETWYDASQKVMWGYVAIGGDLEPNGA